MSCAAEGIERVRMMLAEAGYPNAEVVWFDGRPRVCVEAPDEPEVIVPIAVAHKAIQLAGYIPDGSIREMPADV